jgi:hypothetical protein
MPLEQHHKIEKKLTDCAIHFLPDGISPKIKLKK